jgi:pimeloyl-ACP methyl ester carboxylesterase
MVFSRQLKRRIITYRAGGFSPTKDVGDIEQIIMIDLSTCTVDDRRLAYRRSGCGEAVLLIHGITTNSFIWSEIQPALSEDYDVIAVDLLGCGGSDLNLEADYSIAAQAELVARFIETLEIGPCHLVGHDIGGGIGQIIAVRHRGAIRSLTVINPVGYDFWPVQPIVAMRTPVLRQLAMATLDLGMLRLVVKRALYHRELLDNELMALFWDQMSTTERRKAFLHLARSLNSEQLLAIEGELRTLDLPTLILRGDADIYLSAEICERLHRDISGSRLERIATGGHFLQIDEPDWVTDHLVGFMEANPK